MATEDIGGVSIGVSADLGPLEQEFLKAVEICEKAGTTLGAAISKAFDQGAASSEDAVRKIVAAADAEAAAIKSVGAAEEGAAEQARKFGEAAQAVIERQQGLEKAVSDAKQAVDELRTGYEQGVVSAETLARAEAELATATKQVAPAFEESASALQKFTDGAQSLMQAGASITAAVTVPIVALGAAAFESANNLDEAFDHIRAATGKIGPEFEGLKDSFRNIFADLPENAKVVSDALALIEQRTNLMGPELEALTTQMVNLAHVTGEQVGPVINATTRAFKDAGIATGDYSAKLDEMFRASQATGVGISQLTNLAVQFGAPMRALGFSFEQTLAIMGSFEKEGVNLQTVMAGLRFALGNLVKEGADPIAGFQAIVEQIKNAKDATEGLSLSFQAFGKRAATDMFDVIRGGHLDIQQLYDTIRNGHDTINQAAEDTKSFGEKWQIFKNQLELALEPLGVGLTSALQSVLTAMTPVLEMVKSAAEWFANLPAPVLLTVAAIAAMAAAVGPVVVALGGLAFSLNAIMDSIPILTGLLSTFGITSSAVAVAEGEAAVATTALGEAATVAETGFTGIIGVIGVGLVSAIAAAALGFHDLNAALAETHKQQADTDKAFQEFMLNMATAPKTLAEVADAHAAIAKSLEAGAISAENANKLLAMLDKTEQSIAKNGFKEAVADLGITFDTSALKVSGLVQHMSLAAASAEATKISMQGLRDALAAAQDHLVQAVENFNKLAAAHKDTAAAALEVAKAQDAVNAATKQLNGTTGEAVAKTTALATATHAFVDVSKAAAAGMLEFASQSEKAWDKVGLLASSQEHINELLAIQKARFDAGVISAAEYNKTLDTAKKINDELVKSLDGVNKIAKEIADAAWAKQMNEAAIAAYNLGLNLKAVGLLAAPVAPAMSELNRAMAAFGIGAGKAKLDVEDLGTSVTYLVGKLQNLADEARKSGDWTPVITALDAFDKRIQNLAKTDLPEAARQLEAFIQGMINMNAPAELVQGQMIKLEAIVDKMGKEGLPQAAAAMKGYLDLLKQVPSAVNDIISKQQNQVQNDEKLLSLLMQRKDAIGAILQVQGQWYADEIKLGELQGQNVEAYVLGAEKTKLLTDANRIATHGLADEYVHMIDDVLKGFDQMGAVMAEAIVNGDNLGKALIGEFKKIGQSILTDLINAALLPLKMELEKLIASTLPDVFKGLKASADGVGNLSAAATAGAAAQAAHTTATVANTGATTVSAASLLELGVAAQLASIQMFTMIGAIAGIVGAVAGIVGDVYLAAIDTKLFHLNTAALSIFNETVNRRADAWEQFNQSYTRLGECKNDLDSIAASIKVLSQAAPAVVAANTQAALEKIASTLDLQLAFQSTIADATKWSLAALNLIEGHADQILDTLAYAIHDDLANVNSRLDAVIGAILYGTNSAGHAADQIANDIESMSSQSMQHANAMLGAAGAVVGAIHQGTEATNRGADVEIASLQAARQSAAQQYASATSIAAQVAALQAQVAADDRLAALLTQTGNTSLANTYRQESAMLARDIGALVPQIGSVVSSANNIANYVREADNNNGGYITSSATMIVGAVYGAASIVANAVGAAVANAGGYAQGGGTTTRIPPKGTQTNVPGAESQNPGNSNSPGGNTGATGAVENPGGYTIPKNSSVPPPIQNPTYDPIYNADGTIAKGVSGQTRTPPPFDPTNPNTWDQRTTYGLGGIVEYDQLGMLHKDEAVLPPDLSLMLRRMASTPNQGANYPTYAGSPGVSGGGETKIYLPVTFNGVTNSRELLDMWTNEVKRRIPRATVFSS